MDAQIKQMEMQAEAQREAQRIEFDKWKTEMDNQTKVLIAEMSAKTDLHLKSLDINSGKQQETLTEIDQDGYEVAHPALADLVNSINQNLQILTSSQIQNNEALLMQQEMAHQNLIQNVSKPKQVVRDSNGKIVGVQ